tara:strand:- start:133 stop:372 length:240 start_codon:yes stop_codon:yes gene_type:complete
MNTTKIQRYYQDSTYYIHKEEAHFVLDKLGRGECSFSDTDKMQEMVNRNFPVSHKGMQVDVSTPQFYRAVEIAEIMEDK